MPSWRGAAHRLSSIERQAAHQTQDASEASWVRGGLARCEAGCIACLAGRFVDGARGRIRYPEHGMQCGSGRRFGEAVKHLVGLEEA